MWAPVGGGWWGGFDAHGSRQPLTDEQKHFVEERYDEWQNSPWCGEPKLGERRMWAIRINADATILGQYWGRLKRQGIGAPAVRAKTPAQWQLLEEQIARNAYPQKREREQLAWRAGLTEKQVAAWLQTQRKSRGIVDMSDAEYVCQPPSWVEEERRRGAGAAAAPAAKRPRGDGAGGPHVARVAEPDGSRTGAVSFLGVAPSLTEARAGALRHLADSSTMYRELLHDLGTAEYREAAAAGGGVDIYFELHSGKPVRVEVRPEAEAARLGWPLAQRVVQHPCFACGKVPKLRGNPRCGECFDDEFDVRSYGREPAIVTDPAAWRGFWVAGGTPDWCPWW